MSKADLFLDSSALFAGVISPIGAARALLLLSEVSLVTILVSEQVIVKTERALARKAPAALPAFRQTLRSVGLRIVRDPAPGEASAHQDLIAHQPDVPILLAAMQARVDYLVTLNSRHFDATVAARSGLRIGTPGDALAWLRNQGKLGEDGGQVSAEET